ncbi:MAG: flagellar assembly protein T N-terminal domain-containing protein [Deltaproteobacteria bacterium]|nr:flagellar assembly protein T N-terminal domain-containing protein [Deltaproteobacteria bacterium]
MQHGSERPASLLLKRASLALILVILAIFSIPFTNSFADEPLERTVESTGIASVSGGNIALARDAAIADALRKAVEQAVGTLVASDTLVENYQPLRDNVYTKTAGYIRSYTVIREVQSPGLYQATVRAVVALGDIKEDLGAMGLLQVKAERPRVLFMIAEKNIGRRYYAFWWWGRSEYRGEAIDMSSAEASLKEKFLEKGFNVVDSSAGTVVIEDAFRVEDLTSKGAARVGSVFNAEVVVFGKALATVGPRTPGSNVGSYIADITAQAVRVDDGVVLGSAKGHGVSRHISEVTGGTEALSKAATDLSDKLIAQIAAKWSLGPQSVTLKIENITDYKRLTEIKNAIKGRVRGVSAVYQRRFEGGTATLELDSRLTAQAIADDIARLGLRLKVTRTTANTIEAAIEDEPQRP